MCHLFITCLYYIFQPVVILRCDEFLLRPIGLYTYIMSLRINIIMRSNYNIMRAFSLQNDLQFNYMLYNEHFRLTGIRKIKTARLEQEIIIVRINAKI